MPNQELKLDINCKLNNLSDAEKEIAQLKMVIGFIIAKLQPHDRQAVINELRNWGVTQSAKEFDQFANPRL
ncbi:hypothetical protein [Atlantibacter subterraneus]|uniref:hypothetical protein n=1 Tax=Atlantibacter subterraneus TaxID=255519 RepID=UPI00289CEF0F|nr:hypothetical protein [Atlantibacter subterranea]